MNYCFICQKPISKGEEKTMVVGDLELPVHEGVWNFVGISGAYTHTSCLKSFVDKVGDEKACVALNSILQTLKDHSPTELHVDIKGE
jgi:hypothetical protein